MKMELFDKLSRILMYFLVISMFIWELSAALAIAHLDNIHECQASNCQIERQHAVK